MTKKTRKSKKAEAPKAEAATETVTMHMTESAVLDSSELEVLESAEAVLDAEAPVHVPTAPVNIEAQTVTGEEQPQVQTEWSKTLSTYTDAEKDVMVGKIAKAIDARIAFEKEKKGETHNIVTRTLSSARAAMIQRRAAAVLMATNVDPEVFNRVVHEGSRYNVYAIGKVADLIRGLTDGSVGNAINLAILKSLFQFQKAKLPFSMETAKLACSDKIKVSDIAVRSALTRHTVSASTAPTQASSTMQALETLGIVKRTGGTMKNPTYELTGSMAGEHLKARLEAAA